MCVIFAAAAEAVLRYNKEIFYISVIRLLVFFIIIIIIFSNLNQTY